VFNMGVGLVLITDPNNVDDVVKAVRRWNLNPWVLGMVTEDYQGVLSLNLWNGLRVKI